MNCVYCEQDIPPGAPICPHCARAQPTKSERREDIARSLIWLILAAIIMLVWTLIIRQP